MMSPLNCPPPGFIFISNPVGIISLGIPVSIAWGFPIFPGLAGLWGIPGESVGIWVRHPLPQQDPIQANVGTTEGISADVGSVVTSGVIAAVGKALIGAAFPQIL